MLASLNTLIENYDVSDIINQSVIVFLLLLLALRLPMRIRIRRKTIYY